MQQYAFLLLNIFLRTLLAVGIVVAIMRFSKFLFNISFVEEIKKENKVIAIVLLGFLILIGLIAGLAQL